MLVDVNNRNKPCPCGSGRKYKKCCLDSDRTSSRVPTGIGDSDISDAPEFEVVIGELLTASTLDQASSTVDTHHRFLFGDFRKQLEEMVEHPACDMVFRPFLDLVNGWKQDSSESWEKFISGKNHSDEVGKRIDLDELDALAKGGQHEQVIRLVDTYLPQAMETQLPLVVGALAKYKGTAHLLLESDRSKNLELAIETLEFGLDFVDGDQGQADLMLNLASAYGQRLLGDSTDNLAVTSELLELALQRVGDDRALHAKILASQATALIRGSRRGSTTELVEAVTACDDSLSRIDREAFPDDWAIAQLNKASALELLAVRREVPIETAEEAFDVVTAASEEIQDVSLVVYAYFAKGRMLKGMTDRNPEDYVKAHEEGVAEDEATSGFPDLLRRAAESLRRANHLADSGANPVRRGEIMSELSDVQERQGEIEASMESALASLDYLTLDNAPFEYFVVTSRVGWIEGNAGAWPEASDALERAVEASNLLFHRQLSSDSRQKEIERSGQLSRWAAFALAAAGRLEDSLRVLENGRTRELRRRLRITTDDDEMLREIPSEMREAYFAAVEGTASGPYLAGQTDPGRELQTILTAIRGLEGFEEFAMDTSVDEVYEAAEARWPVIYVNPTPWGTQFLVVSSGPDPELSAFTLKNVSSMDVLMALVAADQPENSLDETSSFLFEAAGDGDRDPSIAVEGTLAWLGRCVSKSVYEILKEIGAVGASLVLCGPIGLTPLAAAVDQHGRCLLDDFEIRYSPSGFLLRRSLWLASRTGVDEDVLLALADPSPESPLPAAIGEVREIASTLPGRHMIFEQEAATRDAFLSNCGKVAYVHLACHARGAFYDAQDSGIELADGMVSADEIAALGPIDAELVVVSACQTAIADLATVGEVFSTSTAFLAAGAKCVLASLWPVDDAATALLMVRLYEEMTNGGLRPPEALRQSQNWLRSITAEQENTFLAKHESLREEFERRFRNDSPPGNRPVAKAAARPYSHPCYWAPFIAIGT